MGRQDRSKEDREDRKARQKKPLQNSVNTIITFGGYLASGMWLSRLFPIPFPSDEFPRVTEISRYISEWGEREGEQAANKVFAVAAVHEGMY